MLDQENDSEDETQNQTLIMNDFEKIMLMLMHHQLYNAQHCRLCSVN